MILRPYQRAAVDALYAYFAEKNGNPLLVLPTGAGKSVIQAAFQQEVMRAWPEQRILLLTHVKELIEQNVEKLQALWPQAPIGIYAASLGKREGFMPIVFASIQSVHKRAHQLGRFDLIIIDECHLVPSRGNTMYRRFLADMREINPAVKIIGMSATPFRLDSGNLHTGDDRIFTDIAYDLPLADLINGGYLCPLVTKGAARKIDMTGVRTQAGDFKASDLDAAVHAGDLTARAADEIVAYGEDRASWLVFCPSVEHAFEVRDELRGRGVIAETLHGGTPKLEREGIIRRFRAGEIRALTNCDVLTTGFDAPAIDLIVFLRPTKSAALYIQMSGRGMRLSPETGKRDCLVLDFAGNVERHGPVDAVNVRDKRPGTSGGTGPGGKECPRCQAVVSVFRRDCDCGHVWPLIETPKHAGTATEAAILSSQVQPEWFPVQFVRYRRHQKPGKPDSLRVDYTCGLQTFAEWVCPEHQGFAKAKADKWMQKRLGRAVGSVSEALEHKHLFWVPSEILIRKSGKYDEIIDCRFTAGPRGEDAGGAAGAGAGAGEGVPELRELQGW
ncbi:MAG: DEAD/DEAH box helicase [Pseudomonadales bacterium]